MTKKKYRRKRQRPFPLIPMVIGLTLIVLAVLALASPGSEGSAESLSSVVPLAVERPAPELSLENIEGRREALADYRDQVVLVNNWATWCPPCKAEMPTLAAYYNEHRDAGFTIVAIDAGEAGQVVSQFARDYGLEFPVWLDPDGEALRAFGNGSLPNSYVIDRSGTIRYAWTGQISKAMLEEYVTPLLAEEN